MILLNAFIAGCNAIAAYVTWRIATDLDHDEDELDRLGKLMEHKPSADTELLILRLQQRVKRKKQQLSVDKPKVGDVEKRTGV